MNTYSFYGHGIRRVKNFNSPLILPQLDFGRPGEGDPDSHACFDAAGDSAQGDNINGSVALSEDDGQRGIDFGFENEPATMLHTKEMRFPADVILVCIRWYSAYPLSYRLRAEMM